MGEKVPKRVKTKEPNLYKIGDSFYFRGTVDGERIEEKIEGSTFSIAKDNKNIFLKDLESNGLAAIKNISAPLFDKFVESRKAEFEINEIRKKTYTECESIVRLHLKPFFGKYKLAEIESEWPAYKLKKRALDLSNHQKVLTTFFEWARSKKLVRYIPDLYYKSPKRKERVNLTDDELFKFLKTALTKNGHTPDLIIGAVYHGNRGNEFRTLRISQVNFNLNYIPLDEIDTKTKKIRVIPLHPYFRARLLAKIEFMKKEGIKSDYFFWNQRDHKRPMAYGAYGDQFERIRVASGIERYFTMHDLRATLQGKAHIDPSLTDKQREDFFGSSSRVQKDIYAKLQVEHLKGMLSLVQIEELDRLFQGTNWGNNGENTKEDSQ